MMALAMGCSSPRRRTLIAPLTFLGVRYDELLNRAYTEIDVNNILIKKGLFAIMHEPESLTDSTPLRELIE